ncbi:MAG: NAD(P)/FAD-dependent oxidoreductase, partial [Campylobacteraceae bacterium]|nr:NAD(P)/FAD-dependent oxidoreductase [Campylobacteraceae bacterium]
TKGGVNTAEINPQTFESLLCPNLYFIGEVLDVSGELGGFNFQWAFACGYVLAQEIF